MNFDVEQRPKTIKRAVAALIGVAVALVAAWWYAGLFGAPQRSEGDIAYEQFTISEDTETSEVIGILASKDFIKSPTAFRIALWWNGKAGIEPGGYYIAKSLDAWELADIFAGGPALVWVTLPEGYRKEQMANILRRKLGWTREEEIAWVTRHTALGADEIEGVYFPDTYLIPRDEGPAEVAGRMRARFNEKFAPLAKEAVAQNIRWPTLLKIASLVQREAASADDMPLVAGIIWNRLLAPNPLKLDIDATIQYARDSAAHYGEPPGALQLSSYNPDGSWWEPIKGEDKKIDSPYNTYLSKGLPPHPIANPGIKAMEAALFPAETKCFYYLHGADRAIHCAETYEEHRKNIEKYL